MKRRITAWVLIAAVVFSVVGRGSTLTVRAWYTPEEEQKSSVEIALEQFAEYEYNDPGSTYNTIIDEKLSDIRRTVAQLKFYADEGILEGFYVAANDLMGLLSDIASIVDVINEIAADSPHDHESIDAFLDLILIYDYVAQAFGDILDVMEIMDGYQFGASWADLETGLIEMLRYILSYGRDFMLTPEYIEWANGFDPWWLERIDELFEIPHLPPYDDGIPYAPLPDIIGEYPVRIPPGANSLKPNIYLYGPEGTEFTVTFCEPELLTAVLPAYEGRWHAALEDGRLTVDGAAGYEFLFYESLTSPALMQTDAGYVIVPETRTEQFELILRQTGFAENEIGDFLEYWTDKLEPNTAYVMYPQDTQTVDIAMPITVEGAAIESYCRIWYYFVPYTGQPVAEPKIEPVQHQGVTLIEWGGVLDE